MTETNHDALFEDDKGQPPLTADVYGAGMADGLESRPGLREGVLVYGGKKFAVGLFWLVADEDGDARLARSRASKAKADFYCIRDSVVVQHGFGNLDKGHRMGMPSAAAYAADMLVGEWHAMFRADNGWWYLAVHGDAIAPDGDRFFTDEEEAFNFFREENDKYKWPRVYAPEDWDIDNSTAELTLERMLEQGPPTPMKPVTLDAIFAGKRNKAIAGLGLVGLIGIIFLISLLPGLILSNVQEPPPLLSTIEQNIGEVKAPPKRVDERDKIIQGVAKLNLVQPSAYVAGCGEAISRLVRPLPGWDIIASSCSSAGSEVRWRRASGSVDLLMQNVGVFPKGSAARLEGEQFIGTLPLADLERFRKEVSPLDRVNAVLELNRRLAGAGELRVNFVQPPAPPAPQGINIRAQEPPPPPPPYLDVNFKTQTSPQVMATYFDVPGLEIISMEWNFNTGVWTYMAKVNLNT